MATKLNLQADFAPVSAQAWKDKIIADLFCCATFANVRSCGARLQAFHRVQPFYRRESLKTPEVPPSP